MIELATDAFATIGLLARPLLSLSRPDNLGDIRVGEAYWSCRLSLAYQHGNEEETSIDISLIWVEVKEGPMEGSTFRLKELLNEGLVGVWQLLGGRYLRNNLLADIRFYNYSFYNDIPDVVLERDIDQAMETDLKDFIHDEGGQDWRIFDTVEETSAEDEEDAVVFGFREKDDTQPFVMFTLNQDANDAQMGAQ